MNDLELHARAAATAPCTDAEIAGLDLCDAQQALLAEIVATPQVRARRRSTRRRKLLGSVAAAASVAVLIAVPRLLTGPPSEPPVQAEAPAPSQTRAPAGESHPLVLLDAPGWRIKHLGSDEMTLASGRGELELTWYAAKQYASYRKDRAEVSVVRGLPVLGTTGRMVTYERGDYAVMLPPEQGSFVEIRSSGLADKAAFRMLVAQLRRVDEATWLAAMPTTVVTPQQQPATAAEMLADVPQPPGFDPTQVSAGQAQDRYSYGESLTRAVSCGWVDAWEKARAEGDEVAVRRAVDAMATSRTWHVLKQMESVGQWSGAVHDMSSALAAGTIAEALPALGGCPGVS